MNSDHKSLKKILLHRYQSKVFHLLIYPCYSRDEQIDEALAYSPKYMQQADLEPGTIVILEEEDNQRLVFAREQVLKTGRKVQNVLTAEEQAMHREAAKNMDADEAQFSVEASLEDQEYLWSDKYRPRKPRYFNRVHTGL